MDRESYYNSLQHAQGREWQDHKYIRKEGNRYIYKDDVTGGRRNTARPGVSGGQLTPEKARAIYERRLKINGYGGMKDHRGMLSTYGGKPNQTSFTDNFKYDGKDVKIHYRGLNDPNPRDGKRFSRKNGIFATDNFGYVYKNDFDYSPNSYSDSPFSRRTYGSSKKEFENASAGSSSTKNGNGLFDSYSKIVTEQTDNYINSSGKWDSPPKTVTTNYIYEKGKLTQAGEAAQAVVSSILSKAKTAVSSLTVTTSKTVSSGKSFVTSLFDTLFKKK